MIPNSVTYCPMCNKVIARSHRFLEHLAYYGTIEKLCKKHLEEDHKIRYWLYCKTGWKFWIK